MPTKAIPKKYWGPFTRGYEKQQQAIVEEYGVRLDERATNQFLNAAAGAAKDGEHLSIVMPAGANRPLGLGRDMAKRRAVYNISTASTVKMAAPENTSHDGDATDISSGRDWLIKNGHKYGAWREFGAADPNHFRWDLVTKAGTPREEAVQLVEDICEHRGIKLSSINKVLWVSRIMKNPAQANVLRKKLDKRAKK